MVSPDARATMIDFRDMPFNGTANYLPSYTGTVAGVGDVTVSAGPQGATLYWDMTDGFGVRYSYEADEVEAAERLIVSFANPVSLNALYLTDLFFENGYLETGSYSLDGGAWIGFSADPSAGAGSNGEKTVTVAGSPLISYLMFQAPGRIDGQNHEFSVAGVDVTASVPEPSTVLLLGVGMIGVALGGLRRKRR